MIETCVNNNFFFDSFSTRSPSHHSELYFFAECEEGVIETCVNYLCGRRGIWAIGNNDRCVAIVALQWSVTMIGAPRVLITVITQPDAGRQILQSALKWFLHSGFEVQNTCTVQSCRQTMSAIQNHKRQWEHWVWLWLAATVVEWKIIGSGQATNLQIHKQCKLKYNAEIVIKYIKDKKTH